MTAKWPISRRLTLLFEPADLWIGLFWDRAKRRLYVFPIPCLGFYVEFTHGR